MKNIYEIENSMDTMSEEVFEKIMNLLDAYWTSYGAEDEAAELKAIEKEAAEKWAW